MANKKLFGGATALAAKTNAINEAGGVAYDQGAKHSLAQLATTSHLGNTFYASDRSQLDKVIDLAAKCEPEFLAKLAVYARHQGKMKDMPALLCAVLATRGDAGIAALKRAFPLCIDNGKQLRNFVQIVRSGQLGRRSLGSAPKRLVQQWFQSRDDERIFFNSVGNDPSLGDVIKLAHPAPGDRIRNALYSYLTGRDVPDADLPAIVQQYKRLSRGELNEIPSGIPFEMLTSLKLDKARWKEIALQLTSNQARINLNTLQRHGAFDDPNIVRAVAGKVCDPDGIRRGKALPYQFMVAYLNADSTLPHEIREALQDGMENALDNVSAFDGDAVLLVDVSGSMHSPLNAMSKVRYIDIAALFAAAYLRKNPRTRIVPFHDSALTSFSLNPRDSIMTNATMLASLPARGTDCGAAMRALNVSGIRGDLIMYLSDNESWLDSPHYGRFSSAPFNGMTVTVNEFNALKRRCPKAKLVCLDVAPYATTQANDRPDTLNVGGFSDAVFDVVHRFAAGETGAHWVEQIERSVI
jgi:60 kDa SS-A/Ro ribonucleoprotein